MDDWCMSCIEEKGVKVFKNIKTGEEEYFRICSSADAERIKEIESDDSWEFVEEGSCFDIEKIIKKGKRRKNEAKKNRERNKKKNNFPVGCNF